MRNNSVYFSLDPVMIAYVVTALCAILLGVYSSIRIHYYSFLPGRTERAGLRLLLLVAATALFIFLPFVGWAFLLSHGPLPDGKEAQKIWAFIVFMLWIGTLRIYMIKNWKAFNARLGRKV